ncbi:MAG: asparagine synthase (glutamine-hydrolyzing) [Desulfobacteraceae bacterium]|nr:asparagine synthase (glutamine-hydrolyzing) [Desulfobacteraceae bacterium]
MCGILAIYNKNKSKYLQEKKNVKRLAREMLSTLKNRGPDEQKIEEIGTVILGHTRLSIIDLNTGTQPIYNEDKNVAVILNGEIYNYKTLRVELERKSHVFRTESDTEVIVHLYEEYGEDCVTYLNGMFAFVVYDVREDIIFAARDRMGEKPLIYCDQSDRFMIASELKALIKDPDIKRNVDLNALSLYLNCMYVPAPLTIFKGILKLPPAHFIKLSQRNLKIEKYWDPKSSIIWDRSEDDIKEEFIELFKDSVKIRSFSDVPLGVFLSGGIDSSAVTAFMAQNSIGKIKTFSVGFHDEIDERPFAKIIADRYNTEHTEILIENRVEHILEDVFSYFDEPFGDSSAVPTYLVSREARKYVKVILTGDGGDELFAGYDSYIDQKYLTGQRVLTKASKELNKLFIKHLKIDIFNKLYRKKDIKGAFEHWLWVKTIFTEKEIKNLINKHCFDIKSFLQNKRWLKNQAGDTLTQAFVHDMNFYLPDDLLKKVDMASMKTSLECRAPFLDHRLVQLSLTIPPNLKLKNDRLKYILKKALCDHLPSQIIERPKTGFGAPINSWLKGELKEMVFDLLGGKSCIKEIIPKREIQKCMVAFYGEKPEKYTYRTAYKVWLMLVLEVWMRNYI